MAALKNILNMNDSLSALNEKFAIDGSVIFKQIEDEHNNLLSIEIRNQYAFAEIQLQGAHLTTWTPNNSIPVIWLSEDAKFTANKSIRGGIPICWPWFGAHQSDSNFPAHGFARTVQWQVESIEVLKTGETQVLLILPELNIPVTQWSVESKVQCIYTVGQTLEVELITHNLSQENIVIGEALHSYFNVSDVRNIIIEGLDECQYLDKLDDFKCKIQAGNIDIRQEVDRVYIATDQECIIEDLGYNRRIRINKKGSLSTIVWNPWLETATKMADLGQDGYLSMVCVESGNAAQDVITIKPDNKHSLTVCYSVDEIT
ncbi:Aldose 1-epimerase family protein YeaD [hydrothermal vent metagenome]|uniref:glucose-6-phosphate 1-epimerase n=1 Tax=hydrothermal vent metagenome TaxID=652676 RepID=A0A3B1AEQ3_9ZZZZ